MPKQATCRRARRLDDRRHGEGRRDAGAGPRDHARRHHDRRRARLGSSSTRPCAPATRVTFDRLDSDGCMSTNDQVTLLASRRERRRRPTSTTSPTALTEVCRDLAEQLQARRRGREPRHRDRGRERGDPKTTPSRSAGPSPATTCSRPRSSATTRTGAACSPRSARRAPSSTRTTSTCAMNGVRVCTAGEPDRPRERRRPHARAPCTCSSTCRSATPTATILTNDLTHDYVHENSAYAS